jgi:hypothetical protein
MPYVTCSACNQTGAHSHPQAEATALAKVHDATTHRGAPTAGTTRVRRGR